MGDERRTVGLVMKRGRPEGLPDTRWSTNGCLQTGAAGETHVESEPGVKQVMSAAGGAGWLT